MQLIIPVHSFVDTITNSSTEIYVSATEKTIETLKKIVNDTLAIAGSTLSCKDLFSKIELKKEVIKYGKNDKSFYFSEAELSALRERLSDDDSKDDKTGLTSDDLPSEDKNHEDLVAVFTLAPAYEKDPTVKRLSELLGSVSGTIEAEESYDC